MEIRIRIRMRITGEGGEEERMRIRIRLRMAKKIRMRIKGEENNQIKKGRGIHGTILKRQIIRLSKVTESNSSLLTVAPRPQRPRPPRTPRSQGVNSRS